MWLVCLTSPSMGSSRPSRDLFSFAMSSSLEGSSRSSSGAARATRPLGRWKRAGAPALAGPRHGGIVRGRAAPTRNLVRSSRALIVLARALKDLTPLHVS